MKKLISILLTIALLFIFIPLTYAANKKWPAGGITDAAGGTTSDMSDIPIASLTDGDLCDFAYNGKWWHYRFDAAATAATDTVNHTVVRPDDYSTAGNWELQLTPSQALDIDSADIQMNCALGTDDTYSGIPMAGLVAGGAIVQWDVVALKSDGKFDAATNATENEVGFGFAVENPLTTACTASGVPYACCTGSGTGTCGDGFPAADTNEIWILNNGCIRNDGWNWTVGAVLYMSTSGDLTETAPTADNTTKQQRAYALSADKIIFPVPIWAKVNNP